MLGFFKRDEGRKERACRRNAESINMQIFKLFAWTLNSFSTFSSGTKMLFDNKWFGACLCHGNNSSAKVNNYNNILAPQFHRQSHFWRRWFALCEQFICNKLISHSYAFHECWRIQFCGAPTQVNSAKQHLEHFVCTTNGNKNCGIVYLFAMCMAFNLWEIFHCRDYFHISSTCDFISHLWTLYVLVFHNSAIHTQTFNATAIVFQMNECIAIPILRTSDFNLFMLFNAQLLLNNHEMKYIFQHHLHTFTRGALLFVSFKWWEYWFRYAIQPVRNI